MLNWAEYEEEETPAERSFWKEVGCALLIGAALAVIFSPLVGCASSPSPRSEICILQLLGHTGGALPVVATTCVSPEAFAESQK